MKGSPPPSRALPPPRTEPSIPQADSNLSESAAIAWPTWLCALAPTAALVTLLSAALHVRLALDHWPSFNESVPDSAWKLHSFLIGWTLVTATGVALPVWTLLLCFRDFRCSRSTHLRQVAVFLGGWALVILWIALDPGRVIQWYLD